MRLGMFYVLGHAATVSVLATAVIFFQKSLPAGIDRWTERLVGLTLLILGVYVLATVFRTRHHQHWVPSSRFCCSPTPRDGPSGGCAKRFTPRRSQRLNRWTGRAPARPPSSSASSMAWARKLLASCCSSSWQQTSAEPEGDFSGLAMFLVGLIAMNTVMCASMAGLSRAGSRRPAIARAITLVTAGYSVVVGVISFWVRLRFSRRLAADNPRLLSELVPIETLHLQHVAFARYHLVQHRAHDQSQE